MWIWSPFINVNTQVLLKVYLSSFPFNCVTVIHLKIRGTGVAVGN